MGKKVYFQDGPLEVTSEFVKARNKSIQISTLESVDIQRKLFFGALVFCGGLIAVALIFGDLLYSHEMAIMIAIGAGVLYLAWQVATFTIYSKLTGGKGWSVTWWIGPLRAMRAAVEQALEDRSAKGKASRTGGAAADDGEAEEGAGADN